MLSELELDALAQQNAQLLAFATRFPLINIAQEVERFLCHTHDLNAAEWAQVIAHPVNPALLMDASHPPMDEYTASSVAMQFRLLNEFAARFPVSAPRQAEQFLRDTCKLSVADWEQVDVFLSKQEAHFLEAMDEEGGQD